MIHASNWFGAGHRDDQPPSQMCLQLHGYTAAMHSMCDHTPGALYCVRQTASANHKLAVGCCGPLHSMLHPSWCDRKVPPCAVTTQSAQRCADWVNLCDTPQVKWDCTSCGPHTNHTVYTDHIPHRVTVWYRVPGMYRYTKRIIAQNVHSNT